MDGDRSSTGELGKFALKKLGKVVQGTIKHVQNNYISTAAYPNQHHGPASNHQPYPPVQQTPYASYQTHPPNVYSNYQYQPQPPMHPAHPAPPPNQPYQPHSFPQHEAQPEQTGHPVRPPGYPGGAPAPAQPVNNIHPLPQHHFGDPQASHSQSPQTSYGHVSGPDHVPYMQSPGMPGFPAQQQAQQGGTYGAQPGHGPPVHTPTHGYHPYFEPSAPPLPSLDTEPSGNGLTQHDDVLPGSSLPGNVSSGSVSSGLAVPQSSSSSDPSSLVSDLTAANAGVAVANLMGKLNLSHTTSPEKPSTVPTSSGGKLKKGWERIISQDLLMQVPTRPHSARAVLGDVAVVEAKMGLSRIIQLGHERDLEVFGEQLKTSDESACEPDFRGCNDKIPCFAISYVHTDKPVGRFKFTGEQWENLKAACGELFECGVKEMRVWLDQCLWLRDASAGSWAHTGIVPYVMWPVISLGVKGRGGEKTLDSERRMWPFVEEVAGLWSMGLIITRELRDKNVEAGSRRWLSFQLRHKCEPEVGMHLVLLNIFHGACDELQTGWQEDVEELKDMAKWNAFCEAESIIVGRDWRSQVLKHERVPGCSAVESLCLSFDSKYERGPNMYLDGSRKLPSKGGFNAVLEMTSGNADDSSETDSMDTYMISHMIKTRYQILTDCGEFAILRSTSGMNTALRLLVAMDGMTSNFSRGHVSWTQVMYGKSSCCMLDDGLQNENKHVLETVLGEQLGRRIRVKSIVDRDTAAIEWV